MKKIVKKNQVIIAAVAVMIVAAGYLNLTRTNDTATKTSPTPTKAAVQSNGDGNSFLDIESNQTVILDDQGRPLPGQTGAEQTGQNENDAQQDLPGDAVLAGTKLAGDYFSMAKLAREQTRTKNLETLMAIVQDSTIEESVKKEAIDAVVAMTKNAEKENICESLLEARGFLDAVVRVEDEMVNVIVNAASVSSQELAQIEDVILRETGVKLSQIFVQHVVLED